MAEAEELAHTLLRQGQATHVDLIPSAYTMSLNPQGGMQKTSSVVVVAHGEGQGAADVVQGKEQFDEQPEKSTDDLEKLWWSSGMLKARAEARNQYDEEIIMAGGDPFFFTDDAEAETKKENEDEDDDGGGPEDLDELAHSSLLGW